MGTEQSYDIAPQPFTTFIGQQRRSPSPSLVSQQRIKLMLSHPIAAKRTIFTAHGFGIDRDKYR